LKYLYCRILTVFTITGIVDESDSLFTYSVGESRSTGHDPNFVPSFHPVFSNPSLESEAIETCGDDEFCLFDIAITGRMDIGLSTLNASRSFDQIVQLSYPSKQ